MGDETNPTDHLGRLIDFGRTSADYERYRPGFPANFFDRLESRGWIAPGQRAADLGTGTGSLALGFAGRGLQVTGIDIAPELLEVARHAADQAGLPAAFVNGPAEATSLDSSAFNLVSAGQAWWWFDADKTIREVQRILVPGGRLLICSFSYLALPGNIAARTEALILEHNPGWPKAGWRGIHPEQVQVLDATGFCEVESFSYVTEIQFSHEAWRGRIRTCNGVGSALTEDQVQRFDTELAQLLDREFPELLQVPHRVFAVSGLVPRG